MEANKWKPGQSGNPAGRPRNIIAEAYQRRMSLPLPDDVCKAAHLRKGSTWADLAALAMAKAAVKGRVDAVREITGRLEGKPTQAVDLNANVSVNRLEIMERRWRERSGKSEPGSNAGK